MIPARVGNCFLLFLILVVLLIVFVTWYHVTVLFSAHNHHHLIMLHKSIFFCRMLHKSISRFLLFSIALSNALSIDFFSSDFNIILHRLSHLIDLLFISLLVWSNMEIIPSMEGGCMRIEQCYHTN